MYTLIAFATQWGSKHGGINSFNTDFLIAFGAAYSHSAQVVCIVASATEEENRAAGNSCVKLVPLPYKPSDSELGEAEASVGIDELRNKRINFEPDKTVWLGHDRITGAAAIAATKTVGGRSAIIHHMSYDHYEAFAENSQTAYEKVQTQKALLKEADLVLAVGPLLRDAASDRLGAEKSIHMLIPGLAEIKVREAPKTFTAFMSGRLCKDATRIKQGHLGIAAFAKAHRDALKVDMPEGLCRQPKLVLRGVDIESERTSSPEADIETELKKFAEGYADCVINLHALPFTQDRYMLNEDLSAASVALMPSWHEGFGLVAWEAIAAGVPLIISKNSGVYQLLVENHPGAGPGCVYPINVRGAVSEPFFREEDLQAVADALNAIAKNPGESRRRAGALRNMLGDYSWSACVGQAVKAFSWPLHHGSIQGIPSVTDSSVSSLTKLQDINPQSEMSLQIPVKRWQRGIGLADSMLLRAEEEVVRFDPARQPMIDMLNAWLDDSEWPQAVRLITGAGGSGKTRLALELCRQRLEVGWLAGFLDTSNDMGKTWQALKGCQKPLLIIIDYAETRQTALLDLIKTMIQTPGDEPVRLLLIARAGGEWWDNLPGKDAYCEALLSGYATSLFNLPPLHPDEQGRQHAYNQALLNFSQALQVSPPVVVPDLSAEHFEHPLYVQMAALLALHGERPTTAEGLTRALLNHERRYWSGLFAPYGWTEPESLAQQLLALATLGGGFATPKQVSKHWAEAGLCVLSGQDLNVLFNALAPLYPGKQGLQAVRPDLLGEALVAQTLLLPECGNLLNAVLARTANQPVRRHALTVLARLSSNRVEVHETIIDTLASHYPDCCKDLVAVAVETPGDLPMLAELAFLRLSPTVKSQVAGMLESVVGEESVQLAGLSCVIAEYLADKAMQKWEKKRTNFACMAEYATALINRSVSLSIAGRNHQALDCSSEAVKLLKQLYDKDRTHHEYVYYLSLNNYSSYLNDAGQNHAALDHAQQALEIAYRLAQKNPDRYEPNYAMLLNNYANYLNAVGRNDAALEHARSALEIVYRLAQKDPDRYDPDCARSLNNYANFLGDAGQNDAALEHARQSLEIRQRLAQNSPDRYDPDYASTLSNYANYLSRADQNDAALEHARQSLETRKRLAQKNPDRYAPDYASSLSNYANLLSDTGQGDVALEHSREALEIRRHLAKKNPERYDFEYAMSLGNYARIMVDSGQNDVALEYASQALEIRKRLALENPTRFEDDRFCSACHVYFLIWLICCQNKDEDLVDHLRMPTTIPPHRRSLLELYSSFVRGCWATDQTIRLENFENIISIWSDLTTATKRDARPYWLCATAWCHTFAASAVEDPDWQISWRDYVLQLKGRIPEWLNIVACRMGFSWPVV